MSDSLKIKKEIRYHCISLGSILIFYSANMMTYQEMRLDLT